MSSAGSEYDDKRQLTVYIWKNYLQYLSVEESLGYKALIGTAKAESASPAMQKWVRERYGHIEDPALAHLFGDGEDAFRDRVRDRILRDHAKEIFLNRCAECDRLVMTPKAKQCLWCGHDWH